MTGTVVHVFITSQTAGVPVDSTESRVEQSIQFDLAILVRFRVVNLGNRHGPLSNIDGWMVKVDSNMDDKVRLMIHKIDQ